MANLSFQQLEQLWTQAGGSAEWAPTMAAVALYGESGGDPTAQNKSGATGLWQILSSAQSAAFNAQHPANTMDNPLANAKAAVALLGNGSGISNWSADYVGKYVTDNGSKPLSAQAAQAMGTPPAGAGEGVGGGGLGGLNALATKPAPTTPAATSLADIGSTGTAPTAPKTEGSGVTNYKGFDLSAIAPNEIAGAEKAIDQYIVDPGYAAKIQAAITQDYGYSGGWIQKIPQLYGILIWAAATLDPSSQTDQNLFLGALHNSSWWQTTDENQRAWDEAQSQDPATAHNALVQAEDHVIATANQVGVTLTKQQILQIGSVYAAQSYEPTGILGTASGTSQDWLDQAVIDTALNVKNTGQISPGANAPAVSENYAGGAADITGATNPQALSGIAQQLYQSFLGVAQNYLLYNPADPTKGLMSTADIMKQVDQALQGYTGTGSSGLASEFVNNATAQFTQQAMTQAASVYPTLKTIIQQGTTPSSYITPITNYVASQLGMGQGQINVMDPQWNFLISSPNPQTGVLGPVTQDQALQKITNPNFSWTDPNGQRMTYANTNNAMQSANSLTSSLAQMFGIGGE